MAFKRRAEPTTVEDERAALRAQHAALEELKHELAERVRAVQEREVELSVALAQAGGTQLPRSTAPTLPPVTAPAPPAVDPAAEQQLAAREAALAEREAQLDERRRDLDERAALLAAAPPPDPDADRLAQIEARLAELRDAEKLFVRTREEVAGRSEAVAARERLVAQRERELDDREDGKGAWAGLELSEVEERLRRLEQRQPGEQTQGFSGGLRKLEQGSRLRGT